MNPSVLDDGPVRADKPVVCRRAAVQRGLHHDNPAILVQDETVAQADEEFKQLRRQRVPNLMEDAQVIAGFPLVDRTKAMKFFMRGLMFNSQTPGNRKCRLGSFSEAKLDNSS